MSVLGAVSTFIDKVSVSKYHNKNRRIDLFIPTVGFGALVDACLSSELVVAVDAAADHIVKHSSTRRGYGNGYLLCLALV